MNWAAIVWFVLMLVFLIVEAACAIHLVSIWFAAGSLVAMLIAFLGGPVWLQVLLWPGDKSCTHPPLLQPVFLDPCAQMLQQGS